MALVLFDLFSIALYIQNASKSNCKFCFHRAIRRKSRIKRRRGSSDAWIICIQTIKWTIHIQYKMKCEKLKTQDGKYQTELFTDLREVCVNKNFRANRHTEEIQIYVYRVMHEIAVGR